MDVCSILSIPIFMPFVTIAGLTALCFAPLFLIGRKDYFKWSDFFAILLISIGFAQIPLWEFYNTTC